VGFIVKNVYLQMGEYSLKTHIFSIEIGGYDEWLRKLGPITMDFESYIGVLSRKYITTLYKESQQVL
jgi:hypothetical protein